MRKISKFSQITELLKYPPSVKGYLQTIHSDIITSVVEKQQLTRSESCSIIKLMNTLSYRVVSGDSFSWDRNNMFNFSMLDVSDDTMQAKLGELYIVYRDIDWSLDSITIVANVSADTTPKEAPIETVATTRSVKSIVNIPSPSYTSPTTSKSSKADLSIQPPMIPRFIVDPANDRVNEYGMVNTIYKTLPVVPETQNEISCTTDVSAMSDIDLLRLFPDTLIRTRSEKMYMHASGLSFNSKAGVVFPIKGFTEEQILQNIIEYPHIYKPYRLVDGEFVSFYINLEIDGTLFNIYDIWKDLPESKEIPYEKEFVKEYVIRRYLLERDVEKIKHKYPLFGTLDPFLTLFMPFRDYEEFGYDDPVGLAKKCVRSRVSYLRSRNPILRRQMNQ